MKAGKSILFWLGAIVVLTLISNMAGLGTKKMSPRNALPFSEFMNQVEAKTLMNKL